MKTNNRFRGYTDAPADTERAMEKAVRIPDFLPRPEELLHAEKDSVKITLNVNRKSLAAFKNFARRSGGKYQTMIRRLLDAYARSLPAGK